MKKIVSSLFVMVLALCLTGCGEKVMKCTNSEDGSEIELYYKGNKVSKVVETDYFEFESEEDAIEVKKDIDEGNIEELDFSDPDVLTATRDGNLLTTVATYIIRDGEENSKDTIIKNLEADNFTCK